MMRHGYDAAGVFITRGGMGDPPSYCLGCDEVHTRCKCPGRNPAHAGSGRRAPADETNTRRTTMVTTKTIAKPATKPSPAPEAAKDGVPMAVGIPLGNVRELKDKDLQALVKSVREELKRRRTELDAKRPQPGQRVKIIGGAKRDIGNVGEVIACRQTRCFVKLADGRVPYVTLDDIEQV